ncbi:DUF1028 domain-containing protein [Rhizosaccharibacter radicis]|uniref:DUF1028 domain-containing protein n=1 Tax=Rhizosaccharibacter radicis TaxID=2782605 RepID=A0ABT1VWL4_9PROT|nr:DUF1028 domain-containing protein [Acetobacteraceae bacterium KSS12]
MTWSIAALDPATGALGIAIATRSLAVGASCPHVRSRIGAVSTQSFTNRYLAPAVLDALERGLSPADAVCAALVGDEGEGIRQLHVVDRLGRTASHTGRHCVEWCGSVSAPGVSVAGNMLRGEDVVRRTLDAFLAAEELPFALRLLHAMEAGEAAGGDRRGRQSAALRIHRDELFADCDLRVDDHPEPLAELRRLLSLWLPDADARRLAAPRRSDPSGFTDIDAIERSWIERGLELRFRR